MVFMMMDDLHIFLSIRGINRPATPIDRNPRYPEVLKALLE
jgi:hypothetical protein